MQVKVLIALVFATLATAAPAASEVMARDDVTSPHQVPDDHNIEARGFSISSVKNVGEKAVAKSKAAATVVSTNTKKVANSPEVKTGEKKADGEAHKAGNAAKNVAHKAVSKAPGHA
jgi:succinylarginine dihydrolase